MKKLEIQSPLLSIVTKINELVDIVSNDSSVVQSFQRSTEFSDNKKMVDLNREIYTITITGVYSISTNSKGNIHLRINETTINERHYELNIDKKIIENLVLCNGDQIYFVSENAEAEDDVTIVLSKTIVEYIYDTKNELNKAINLYKPINYENLTAEQIESLKGDPFRYTDFTEQQLNNLKGPSAYQVWLSNGNKGSEKDFLLSLKGADGAVSFKDLTEAEKKKLYPDLTGYAKKTEIPSLEGYATTEDASYSPGFGININNNVIEIDKDDFRTEYEKQNDDWRETEILGVDLKVKKDLLPKFTKQDIGLGNLSNYPIATESDAIKGETNQKYMTPWRTRQFVKDFTHKTVVLSSESEYEQLKRAGRLDRDTLYFIKES